MESSEPARILRTVIESKVNTHRIYTVKELLSLQDDPRRWIIPNMIPRVGRTIIYGKGGVYKSTLVFDIAVAIASGGLFIGKLPIQTYGPVLLVSTEGSIFENKDRILQHIRYHDADPNRMQLHYCQQPFSLDDPVEGDELERAVAAINPVLIVLDPLDSFFSGDENSARETKVVRRKLNAIIAKYETSVLVIHHEGKKDPDMRGSSAWRGWTDSGVRVTLTEMDFGLSEKKKVVKVEADKQRNGKTGELLKCVVDHDDVLKSYMFTFYTGANGDDIRAAHFCKEIYRALYYSQAPLTNKGLAELLKIPRDKLSQPLNLLETQGLIAKDQAVERSNGKDDRIREFPAWRALHKICIADRLINMIHFQDRETARLEELYELYPEPASVILGDQGDINQICRARMAPQSLLS